MIVELKSLLPELEESIQESALLLQEAAKIRESTLPDPDTAPQLPWQDPVPGGSAETTQPPESDNTLPMLLEQLIACSERNAASSEKIADLLESRENNSFPVYN